MGLVAKDQILDCFSGYCEERKSRILVIEIEVPLGQVKHHANVPNGKPFPRQSENTPPEITRTKQPTKMKISRIQLLTAMCASALAFDSAHAALTLVGDTQWNDNASRTISVFSGNSFIDASIGGAGTPVAASSVFKSFGTVSEYNFVNEVGTTNVLGSYASSGSRVGAISSDDTGITNSTLIATAVYTTVDPTGSDPANFISDTHVNGLGGSNADIYGTINISGLSSGTLFFLIGSNGAEGRDTSLVVTQGASVVTTAQSGGGYYQDPGGTGFWANGDTISAAVEIDFTNADGNTISYAWNQNGAGKFMGVILSDIVAVPEPSAALLGGLGMLAMLRRRH